MRALIATAALLMAAPATAALAPGAKAPDFSTQGALGGKPFIFSLASMLKRGPVVLYFFPKAFTEGCTLEARAFAENTAAFRKAGATVVGVAADNIEDLKRFSVKECSGKFPVAVATPGMIRDYDVALPRLAGRSNRTSYVIARDGRIAFAHSNLDHREHVAKTLTAVRTLAGRKGG